MTKIIKSTEDNSVNFVNERPMYGNFESRYVRRGQSYFIAYLSSQSGCDQACRMCHLTASGQNKFVNATLNDFLEQAENVLALYLNKVNSNEEPPAEHMHFNFMARGEPLNNPVLHSPELFQELRKKSEDIGLNARFLVSTIIPESFEHDFKTIFPVVHPYIYYSLYSLSSKFRKKWLNRAMNPEMALIKLKEWSEFSEHKPKIHYAFIENENDSEKDVLDIVHLLKKFNLPLDFNIVRYNSYSEKYGQEPSEAIIQRNADIIRNELNNHVKVIPRVGKDVKASCGMFVEDN